jgi:hypothetical protein
MIAVGPLRANHAARLVATVVLPAPPLLFTTSKRFALIIPNETKLLLSTALSVDDGDTFSSSVEFKFRTPFNREATAVWIK